MSTPHPHAFARRPMVARRSRLLLLLSAVCAVIAGACGSDQSHPATSYHRCPQFRSGSWEQTQLVFYHDQPDKCPIPVAGHYGGQDVKDFGAKVGALYSEDADEGDLANVMIVNGVGVEQQDRDYLFHRLENGASEAAVYISYNAATGTLYMGDPDDTGYVSLTSRTVGPVFAGVVLQVAFGQSATQIAGPSGESVDSPGSWQLYANSGAAAPYSYAWYLDGVYAGDSPTMQGPLGDGGTTHTLQGVVTDANGWVSATQRNVFVSYNNSGCIQLPCP